MALTISDVKRVRPLDGAIVRDYELASAAAVGDVVYINSSDLAAKARTNAAATARGLGVVVAGEGHLPGTSFSAGQTVSVVVMGPVSGVTGMDLTLPVYVSSATAGAMTQTAPSGANTWTQVIGYPLRTDVLMVHPQNTAPTSNS